MPDFIRGGITETDMESKECGTNNMENDNSEENNGNQQRKSAGSVELPCNQPNELVEDLAENQITQTNLLPNNRELPLESVGDLDEDVCKIDGKEQLTTVNDGNEKLEEHIDFCMACDEDDSGGEDDGSSKSSYNEDSNFTTYDNTDDSSQDWRALGARPIEWVQRQIQTGVNPRQLLTQIIPSEALNIANSCLTEGTMWRILANIMSEPPRRSKLPYINTLDDVVNLIHKSTNIVVLTGAGVSVSCGIPDFRSSDGIYARLAKEYHDLPDPQSMFDINYFSHDPRPFFKFAREIYPGQFEPSHCHRFIKMLEERHQLLRNYTQNIDTLEKVAGIENVIECHGSFSTASCTKCLYQCTANDIRDYIFQQRIPVCPLCQPKTDMSVDASQPINEEELHSIVRNGIMKPDIVFFGEGLPDEFHTVLASDKSKCDLLIVIGSSLKVRPVALIPSSIPANVPQILINRERLPHLEFDVELLGDSDVIINQLCHRLGGDWKSNCHSKKILRESTELMSLEKQQQQCVMQDTDTQSKKSYASTSSATSHSAFASLDSGIDSSSSASKTNSVHTDTDDFTDAARELKPFDKRVTEIAHIQIKDSDGNLKIGSTKHSSASTSTTSIVPHVPIISENQKALSDSALSDFSTSNIQKQQSKVEENNTDNSAMLDDDNIGMRLPDDCYYWHENSSMYVFPGALVSYISDSEIDEDEKDGYSYPFAKEKDSDSDMENDEYDSLEEERTENIIIENPTAKESIAAEIVDSKQNAFAAIAGQSISSIKPQKRSFSQNLMLNNAKATNAKEYGNIVVETSSKSRMNVDIISAHNENSNSPLIKRRCSHTDISLLTAATST